MPGVERHRGLPVPRFGTVCLLAAAISACGVAWIEIHPVSDSAAPSLQPLDPYEHLRSIDEIVENDPDAAASLVRLLADDDPRARSDALIGLSRLGSAASQTVEAVRERLADEAPAVRNHALAAFARVCPDRSEVCTVAARHLAGPPTIRDTASRILREHGRDAIPALAEMLRSPSPSARELAAQLIRLAGHTPGDALR